MHTTKLNVIGVDVLIPKTKSLGKYVRDPGRDPVTGRHGCFTGEHLMDKDAGVKVYLMPREHEVGIFCVFNFVHYALLAVGQGVVSERHDDMIWVGVYRIGLSTQTK